MDRSRKVVLIAPVYEADALGQQKVKTTTDGHGQVVQVETWTEIFCKVSSVGYNEWHQAAQNGITPEYTVTVLRAEYSGQKIAELDGDRYSIYRTYVGKGETVELYLERKAGV